MPDSKSVARNAALWEVLGLLVTGLPGLGWLYAGRVSTFVALLVGYIAVGTAVAGLTALLPQAGVALLCLAVPGVLVGLFFSARGVYHHAQEHPEQASWVRPLVVLGAWLLFLCVLGGLVMALGAHVSVTTP